MHRGHDFIRAATPPSQYFSAAFSGKLFRCRHGFSRSAAPGNWTCDGCSSPNYASLNGLPFSSESHLRCAPCDLDICAACERILRLPTAPPPPPACFAGDRQRTDLFYHNPALDPTVHQLGGLRANHRVDGTDLESQQLFGENDERPWYAKNDTWDVDVDAQAMTHRTIRRADGGAGRGALK